MNSAPTQQRPGLKLPAAVVLFPAILFLLGLVWMGVDRSVWPWDPAWYGEVSINLYNTARDNPSQWWSAMVHAFGFKAPLLAWIGQAAVPLRTITGSYEDALLLIPLLSSMAACVVILKTVWRLFAGRTALFVATGLFLTAASLFVGLSHEYFTEPLQLLCVAGIFFLLATDLSGAEIIPAAAALLAAGMLAKVSTPLYVLFPGLILCADALRRMRRRPSTAKILCFAAAALIAVGLAAAWYVTNWASITAFMRSASGGEAAELYGHHWPFLKKLAFWMQWFGISFFNSEWGGYLWLLLAGGAAVHRITRGGRIDRIDLVAGAALAQTLLVIGAFSTQVNEESRYLLPTLPALAIVIAYSLNRLPVLVAPAILWFAIQTAFVISAAFSSAPPIGAFAVWLHGAASDPLPSEILHETVSATCLPELGGRYMIIGHEIGLFNANSASLYMAEDVAANPGKKGCYYTSLGYAESNTDRSWNRILEINPEFIIFRSDLKSSTSDPFNAVSEPMKVRLGASPLYRRSTDGRFPFLELFKRQPQTAQN